MTLVNCGDCPGCLTYGMMLEWIRQIDETLFNEVKGLMGTSGQCVLVDERGWFRKLDEITRRRYFLVDQTRANFKEAYCTNPAITID